MNEYIFEVTVTWTQVIDGKNLKQAKENLKSTFDDEYNFEPDDKEIKLVGKRKG